MKKHEDLHRLLSIITLLQAAPRYGAAALAERFGVTTRTIHRDIRKLQSAGIPVTFDRRAKAYRIDRAFFLPPVELTAEEALALSALVHHIAEPERIAFLKAAHRALAKVQAALPGALREEVAAQVDHLFIQTARSSPPDDAADVYERIRAAIRSRRALLCEYEAAARRTGDSRGAPDETNANERGKGGFLFEPYALFFSVRSWYAIGRHSERNAVRSLKLQRFSRIEPTDVEYHIPASFSVEKHLGNAWRMIRGEPDHDVEIRFDPAFGETIAETLWHPTQDIEEHEDGSATFRCTVSGLDEIVWWVLSMGPHAKVVKPRALARRVAELAGQTAALYGSKSRRKRV